MLKQKVKRTSPSNSVGWDYTGLICQEEGSLLAILKAAYSNNKESGLKFEIRKKPGGRGETSLNIYIWSEEVQKKVWIGDWGFGSEATHRWQLKACKIVQASVYRVLRTESGPDWHSVCLQRSSIGVWDGGLRHGSKGCCSRETPKPQCEGVVMFRDLLQSLSQRRMLAVGRCHQSPKD